MESGRLTLRRHQDLVRIDSGRDGFGERFLDRVFDGAASQLVLSLIRSERIPPEELERMQLLILEARRSRKVEGQP